MTTLVPGSFGELKIGFVRNYAHVYLNGKFVTTFNSIKEKEFKVDLGTIEAPGKLEILVEAMGHLNYASDMQ